jgi:hypothetical protein
MAVIVLKKRQVVNTTPIKTSAGISSAAAVKTISSVVVKAPAPPLVISPAVRNVLLARAKIAAKRGRL